MARGIKIRGSNSQNVQIDNNYVNYVYYESGTTTVSAGNNYIPFTPTEDKVLFGVSPTTSGVILDWGLTVSGTYFTSSIVKSSADQTINWGVFVDNSTPTLSGTGDVALKIYKTDGTVAFDSRNRYFKVAGIRVINNATAFDVNVTVVSADNYFIVEDLWYEYQVSQDGDDLIYEWFSKGVKRINATTIAVSKMTVRTYRTEGSFGSAGGSSQAPYYLVEIEEVN